MNKNIMSQIAQLLGVELGEEFKVNIATEDEIFRITEIGLELKKLESGSSDTGKTTFQVWKTIPSSFVKLCTGEAKIVKLPFNPKQGDVYWTFYRSTFSDKWLVTSVTWANTVTDIAKLKVGWCYRTEAEAKSALPEIAKEQGVGHEL